MKSIKTKIYENWILTRLFFKLKIDAVRLTFAIFMCDALQRAKNKRFYVIPNAQDKLIWVCNDDIKLMKQPRKVNRLIDGKLRTFTVRLLPKHASHIDIMRQAVYYTPTSRNNSDGLTPQQRQQKKSAWLKYMEKVRLDRLTGKLK